MRLSNPRPAVDLLGLRWIEEAARGLEPMTNYQGLLDGCEGTARPRVVPEFHPPARSTERLADE